MGIVELEQRLLVGELDGQKLGQARADPRGIVELPVDVFIVVGKLFQRAAHGGGQPLTIRRQRQLGLQGQPRHLSHVQTVAGAPHALHAELAHAHAADA